MKKLLYYFYLLCFLILIGFGVASLIANEDYIFSLILLQLVWGPISVFHCLYKVTQVGTLPNRIGNQYKVSFALTVIYFSAVFLISFLPDLPRFFKGDTATFLSIGVIPWTMLAYFTLILHLDINYLKRAPQKFEENLIH